MITTDRIQQLLEPEFVTAMDRRSLDDLRPMRDEAHDVENTVSYYRRLAQARIEILVAEQARRERGGSLEELVAQLPLILGADARRSSPGTTRLVEADKIPTPLHWPDGRERILEDNTLADLPMLSDEDLNSALGALVMFEHELSETRRQLHVVIDGLDLEIGTRQVAGTAG